MKRFLILVLMLCVARVFAQPDSASHPVAEKPEALKINLNDDGSHYFKATFTAQVWTRYNESNPGTTVFGYEKTETFDIGLRRVRTQLYGKVHDRFFLYTQFGINNFNSISARKPGLFFHDVVAEYYIMPRALQVGTGLTAWTGFSRYASPSVASIMGFDAPLFEQTTNDANDQFLRKLSVYAKGKIGKLDYRVIASDPFAAQNSTVIKPISVNSDFSYKPPKLQSSAYVMYQFLDEESNLTPYMTGTYLGRKKVFNIGGGFEYQQSAMWHWNDMITKDTIMQDMFHYAADMYFDYPTGKKGAAISAYAAYMHMGFGKDYIRNLGVMNPADGSNRLSVLNGGGNAYPMMGTGNVYYGQVGYLLPSSLLGKKNGQIMPYMMYTYSKFERLKEDVSLFDFGLNYFIDGHRAKLSLNYQSRPVFDSFTLMESSRRSMMVFQCQIAI